MDNDLGLAAATPAAVAGHAVGVVGARRGGVGAAVAVGRGLGGRLPLRRARRQLDEIVLLGRGVPLGDPARGQRGRRKGRPFAAGRRGTCHGGWDVGWGAVQDGEISWKKSVAAGRTTSQSRGPVSVGKSSKCSGVRRSGTAAAVLLPLRLCAAPPKDDGPDSGGALRAEDGGVGAGDLEGAGHLTT